MRTPIEEREVSVGGYTFKPDGTKADTWEVYTSDYSYMLKFDRFCKNNPEEWQLKETLTSQGDVVGKKYTCTIGCVLFREKTRHGRPMTDEEKQAARERFAKMREDGIL